MNLIDRYFVEGTEPPMYIGHRQYLDPATRKVKVCRPWYAEWNELGAKRHHALRTHNKQMAIRNAHELCRKIAAGELNAQTSRKSNATLTQLVADYITVTKGMKRTRKTVEKYQHVLNDMVKQAESSRVRLARQYTETLYWAFSTSVIDRELAEKTRYHYLTIVKQFFRWAAQNRFISVNPLAAVKLEAPSPTEQPCYTAAQISQILAASEPRNHAVYAFLAFTGARFGEAAALQWDDLKLDNGAAGFVVIQRGGSHGTTKSGRSRQIPLHPELRKILDKVPRHPTSKLVFHAHPSPKYPDGSGPIDNRRMLLAIKRLCKHLKFKDHEQYKLHTFRHFFASSLATEQVSYQYALDFMGHTDSDILKLYYKSFDPIAEKAILAIKIPATDAKIAGKPAPSQEAA